MFIRSSVICLRSISEFISRVMQRCSFRVGRTSENVKESKVTSSNSLFCPANSLKEMDEWTFASILKPRKATNPHVGEAETRERLTC